MRRQAGDPSPRAVPEDDRRHWLIFAGVGGAALLLLVLVLLIGLLPRPRQSADGRSGAGSANVGSQQTGGQRGAGGLASGSGGASNQRSDAATGMENQASPSPHATGDAQEPPRSELRPTEASARGSTPSVDVEPPPVTVAEADFFTFETPRRRKPAGASGESEFFGIQAKGKKFVYVVDCSGSMNGQRFDEARAELLESVSGLGEDQSFFVYLFNNQSYAMYSPDIASAMTPATTPNIAKLERWVSGRQAGGGTEPLDALTQAIDMRPDAIYLLTDGQFSAAVVGEIQKRNRNKVVIHTIAFVDPSGEWLLKQISSQNGGLHRFIP
jgi:Mg-chelatase subunit ChlD